MNETTALPSPQCEDLFDEVIQSLFGMGLRLESAAHMLEADPALVRQEIDTLLEGLQGVIGVVRERVRHLDCRDGHAVCTEC